MWHCKFGELGKRNELTSLSNWNYICQSQTLLEKGPVHMSCFHWAKIKKQDRGTTSIQKCAGVKPNNGDLGFNDAAAMRTSLKKWICILFSLYRNYAYPLLLCQMKANPPRVEFFGAKSKFRKRKFRRCLFTSSIEREIRHFHVVVVQKRAKKCTKKRDARAKVLFCL